MNVKTFRSVSRVKTEVSQNKFQLYRTVTPIPDIDTPVKTLSDTPKSVKFSEKSPERISPRPFQETHTATDVEFLLMKIRSMKVEEEERRSEAVQDTELSFSLPGKLELPDLSLDTSHSDMMGELVSLNHPEGERSVLLSQAGWSILILVTIVLRLKSYVSFLVLLKLIEISF